MENKTIEDYIILEDRYIKDLSKMVMTKIAEGYIPQGGVSADYDGNGYTQAMIKYALK